MTPPAAHDWPQLLADVPLDWALIPLNGNKQPIDHKTGELLKGWNDQPGHTPEDLAAMNGVVRAVGVLLGPASGGLLAVDFDGRGATEKFLEITGHNADDLPPTVAVTSGKYRRQQRLFTVDPDWYEHLRTRQFKDGSNKRTILEFRWHGAQSVIAGEHPETKGYGWVDGCSPADLGPAAAPEWLLEAVYNGGIAELPEPSEVRVNSDDGERAARMLQHLPPVDFESYDDWLKVGMALHGTDPGLLSAWVKWCRPMGNFDEAECLAKWQSFGRYRGRQKGIASLHYLAKRYGYQEPKRSQPAAPGGGQVESAPAPQQHQPLSMPEVSDRLREVIAEGIGAADLAALITELATAADQYPANIKHLADAIRTEQRQAVEVRAEAATLAAEVDRRQIGQQITAQFLLPASIAAAIEIRARYLPCDGPSAVLPFLAVVAGLTKLGTAVEGSAAAGYRVPTNLFTCLVARSGAKKSPIGKALVLEPIRELCADIARSNQRDRDAWADVCRDLKKGEPRPPEPHPKRLTASETTGEALAEQLQAQEAAGLGLLINRDELSGLFGSLNKYRGGRGDDEQQLLELFDGGGQNSLRIGGGRHYSRSQLSIWGSTQPDVLRELVANGDASGLWARFLFVPLPERAVRLPTARSDIEVAEVDAAERTLAAVADAIYRLPPQTYRLAPDAVEHFAHYEYSRQMTAQKANLNAQSALYGKSAGKVLRVAGVLHLLQIAAGVTDRTSLIGLDTLDRAITLVDHLDAWALSFHAEVAAGGVGDLMRTVHKIAEEAGAPIRWKEVAVRLSKRQRKEVDVAAVAEAMQALAAAGFGEVETGKRGACSYKATCSLP